MILRVPDYFKEFSCIADKCKDSCCIGWEIDIDEDTYDFYKSTRGTIGNRLQKHMYDTEDKEHSFQLEASGRCPFLNSKNLCDICIELGEEALSEVCTEYPRFAIEYGEVLQKCLSLSCEEVGRMVFSHEQSVTIVDYEMPDELYASDGEDDSNMADEDEHERILALERLQQEAIALLQDRKQSIEQRMLNYLELLLKEEKSLEIADRKQDTQTNAYDDFLERFAAFTEMETLNEEWEQVKAQFRTEYTGANYMHILSDYLQSEDYHENDYEQLMVYFTFRYFMNAVYDYDVASYAKLALIFTLVIRDMDALRFHLNGDHFALSDRIDNVRIFSKEVEHSEDNIELAKEAFLFDDVYKEDRLKKQILHI